MDRFQGHFGVIQRNDHNSDIAKHYNSEGHEGTKDMILHIVDFIYLHPESKEGGQLRDHIESNWIHRLRTPQPIGLNIQDIPTLRNRTRPQTWVP